MNPLSSCNRNVLAAAVVAAFACQGAVALPETVTNGNDAGPGSLRAALGSGASEIAVTTSQNILITETLVYDSTAPIAIYGSGQTIRAHDDFTLFEASQGADVTIVGLNFKGPGGFDIENQSAAAEPGKGIFIDVRDDQTGRVDLVLNDVKVEGVANHGVHVSDCSLADLCGGGGGGAGDGSAASVHVVLTNVNIKDVGNGKFDADGLRVDERAGGSITYKIHDSSFTRVGADGVELDEGQNGRVEGIVTDSKFNENGGYCDPALLEDQLATFLDGEPDEAEFEDSDAVLPGDLPGPVTGSLDDLCFEYEVDTYDSGFVEAYEYGIDVDDGFDIDEAGSGSLIARIIGSKIRDNLDEGLDFDEEDGGRIDLVVIETDARGNTDDGFKSSESGGAGVEGLMHRAKSIDNGGKGIVFEEENGGSLNVLVNKSTTRNNDDGVDTGIEVVQEDGGSGLLIVNDSNIDDGIDDDGVTVIVQ